MKLKILSDELIVKVFWQCGHSTFLTSLRISKDFEIEIDDNKTIIIHKWMLEADPEYDSGWDFVDKESEKIYKKLSEEQQDELNDFISDISL